MYFLFIIYFFYFKKKNEKKEYIFEAFVLKKAFALVQVPPPPLPLDSSLTPMGLM